MSDRITHVIFDLEGILINTPEVVWNVLKDYAKSLGQEVPEYIRYNLINSNSFGIFDMFYDSIEMSKDLDRIGLTNKLIKQVLDKGIQLVPGVDRLVQHLYKHRIPMAIVSASYKQVFDLVTKDFVNYFDKFFSHSVFGSDDKEVKYNKPKPDIYFVCAKRFKPRPERVNNILIIEDSMTGITGAIDSRMKTLLINDRKDCNFDEIADRITLIADSFNDFKPESIGLPAYET